MAEKENKSLNYRYVEKVINQGNINAIDEHIDPSVADCAATRSFPTKRQGVKLFTGL